MTHEQVDSKINKRKEKFNKQNNETKKQKKFDVGCNYKGLVNVATKDVRCSFKHKCKSCKVSNCKAWNLIM
jgi:hypothetical protein